MNYISQERYFNDNLAKDTTVIYNFNTV